MIFFVNYFSFLTGIQLSIRISVYFVTKSIYIIEPLKETVPKHSIDVNDYFKIVVPTIIGLIIGSIKVII